MTTSLVIDYVCPALGTVTATMMWLVSLPFILMIRHIDRSLKELEGTLTINPYPYLFMILNCLSWVVYSFFISDFFVFFSNVFGLLLGLFYTLSALTILHLLWKQGKQLDTVIKVGTKENDDWIEPFSERSTIQCSGRNYNTANLQDSLILESAEDKAFERLVQLIETILIFIVFFWLMTGLAISVLLHPPEGVSVKDRMKLTTTMIGLISCIFTVSYYASPLAMMVVVIQKRDSSTLYFPLIVVNCVNAFLWFFYGFLGRHDLNIWIPNGLGVLLTFLQFFLIFLYPVKGKERPFFTGQEILCLLAGHLPKTRVKSSPPSTVHRNSNEFDI